ncbi:MAG: VOC family protein, partial [Pseudomonadota bacterium]
IHVYVSSRREAAAWYHTHLGLSVAEAFEFWADDPGGPLTLRDASDRIHLALFRRTETKPVSLAFGANAQEYLAWRTHVRERGLAVREADHRLCRSIYVEDPWDNQWEITCYDMDALAAHPVLD